ncbi:hypothetical protein BVC80_949g76 [Macleaya cordata]|uniref:Uncharacterized protein n=1 Tax=Macleaya cordata TaxID=56857 RepID=A0A200QX64_MACCD|nr:hypothetical protein BVC80_949g76 [Macleaya cordata]
MPQDALETHSNAGFSEGYEDHVYKRSVIVCNPNEGCVIKTQTIVEEVSLPAMTIHGNSYPAMGGPMEVYGAADYGDGYPAMGEPTKVYGAHDYGRSPPAKGGSEKVYGVADNRGNRPVSPPYQRSPKTDEFISDIHTDAGRPSKTGPMSIMNWRQRPNSNGYGASNNNGKDGFGTNIYGGHRETADNGFHPHFEGYHGRSEMETDTKKKPTKITEVGFTKPTNNRGAAVDNWMEARKSPPAITSPIRSVTEKPTKGRPIVPPTVATKEIFPSTINSREAARRYGGFSVPPQAIKEAETYTPTIDSNKAAQMYKGQLL